MATWQKVLFSGSAITELNNDSQFDTLANVLNVTSSLSGSMSDARNALISEVTSLSSSMSTARDAVAAQVSGSIVPTSSSLSTRVTAVEAFSSSLDDTFLTEEELNAGTGSIVNNATSNVNVLTFTKGDASTFDVEVVQSGESSETASLAQTAPYSGVLNKPSLVSSSAFSSPSQGTLRAILNGITTDVDTGVQIGDSPTFVDVTTTGDVTIDGDLTVDGSTTAITSATASVADKFVLFASGSTSASDGGFIVQGQNGGIGKGFGYDASDNAWALQTDMNQSSSAIEKDAFVQTAEVKNTAPTDADPAFGTGSAAAGTFWVDTSTNFIWISTPDPTFIETHYLTGFGLSNYLDFGGRTSGFYEQGQTWSYGWIQQTAAPVSFADYINFSTDDFAIPLFVSGESTRYSRNVNTTGENSLGTGAHSSEPAFQGEDCWMFTFDSTTIKGYLNGTEVFSSTTLTRMPSSGAGTGDIFFGSDKMNNSDTSAYNTGARSFFVSDQVLPASMGLTAFNNSGDITGHADYNKVKSFLNVTSDSVIDIVPGSTFNPTIEGTLTFTAK